jgi:hypothetical protein
MRVEKARRRIFDTGFLLGGIRRRAAIKVLAALPGTEGVLVLVAALGGGHPKPQEILHALARLSPAADAEKIEAIWTAFAVQPNPALGGVLAGLGWPPGRPVPAKLARDLLAVATAGAAPGVLLAVVVIARALPVDDEAGNDAIYAAWLRSQSPDLERLITEQGRRPGVDGVLILAHALGTRPDQSSAIWGVLRGLSPTEEAEKVAALWGHLASDPNAALGGVLAGLGWPPGRPVPAKLARDLLAVATAGAAPEVLQAVVVIARALPVDDEAGNDAVYGAWVRSQSPDLERLIADQGRQPASPALEALHALVTGRLERYAALKDQDGALPVQAFALAPEPFRARLAQSVAASPDRAIKEAYRRALTSSTLDKSQRIENLKLVGDEDGLFEQSRVLRLLDVLGLCERWAGIPGRPSAPAHRAAVDRAVEAYRSLGQFQIEPGPKLPDGMVDLIDYWRAERPSDADLRADLSALKSTDFC